MNRRGIAPATARPSGAANDPAYLDFVFGALSDPIRRGIVTRLTRGACSVTEVGAPFPVSAPAISRHLGVLERCGLIVRWQEGRVHYCRLTPQPLSDAASWIERHQAFWERQLDALADYLDREDEQCGPPPRPKRAE